MIQRILIFSAAAVALALSGCVNLKPQPDLTQLYLLAANVVSPADLSDAPASYVERVELPGYLEGTRIYYRSAGGILDSATGARWAEALSEALPQALAMNLQATGQTQVRAYYPSPKMHSGSATVSVKFERFSARADGQVEVIAQWQVVHPDGSTDSGRYVAPEMVWDGSEPAAYVALLDRALADLAETIAETI